MWLLNLHVFFPPIFWELEKKKMKILKMQKNTRIYRGKKKKEREKYRWELEGFRLPAFL